MEYKTVQEVLDDNHAIFNYVYDRFGFRYGIVVACKGLDKWHPRIGWALFEEVRHREVFHNKMGDIPMYSTLFNYDAEGQKVDFVDDVYVPTVIETVVDDKQSKIELFELACKRANYNSFDFFVSCNPTCSQYGTDLRLDPPEIKINYQFTDGTVDSYTYAESEEEKHLWAKNLRKTIRETEYRAFKYFKK